MEQQLVERFNVIKRAYEIPDWAWPLNPSIPFIGEDYEPGKSLLIYASAENLTEYKTPEIADRFAREKSKTRLSTKDGIPKWFLGKDSWNRYRARYKQKGSTDDNFFPEVGIQPATDGGLLVGGLYISQKLGLPVEVEPRDFLEKIAISNWCKYTDFSCSKEDNAGNEKKPRNKDYAGKIQKLKESLLFTMNELSVLKPKVVLLPETIWEQKLIKVNMKIASPETRFLPAYQFNQQAANLPIMQGYEQAANDLEQSYNDPILDEWLNNIRRLSKFSAWKHLAKIEEAIRLYN